ncbi:MAG: DUF4345 family protein [Pseudomonadales bacterium]|nr:DUF4345 family protein [Pseudomonadales bacterium]
MTGLLRIFPAFYLLLNALVYLLLAWLFVQSPQEWFERLGVVLQDANGYTELRSMYIGLMASLGLFFLLALLLKSWRVPALALALISYTALALVRAWGLYAEELGNALMQQLLLTEIVSALLAVLALYCQQLNARRPVNPYR